MLCMCRYMETCVPHGRHVIQARDHDHGAAEGAGLVEEGQCSLGAHARESGVRYTQDEAATSTRPESVPRMMAYSTTTTLWLLSGGEAGDGWLWWW